MPSSTISPAYYSMTIYQGADFAKLFTWLTGSPSVAVNLTGYTARMQIREEFFSADPLITLTTENGGITLGGAAGTILVEMTDVETRDLSFVNGVYDVELISGAGVVTRILMGAAILSPEVTR